MKQWLISKIPAWVLRYWVWRNWRLVCSGHPRYAFCIQADIELAVRGHTISYTLGPENPVGVPEWITEAMKPYGEKR